MIKTILYGLLFIILSINFFGCNENKQKIRLLNYSKSIVLPGHVVPDTSTAVKIAELLWLSHYGEYVIKERPYEVTLEFGIDTIWHIRGIAYFSDDKRLFSFGSLAYISIRSRDCKIIEMNHDE
jgi:hypothetical protein